MEKVFRGKWSKEKKVDKWQPRRSTCLSFMAFLDFVVLFLSVNFEGRQVGAKKIDRCSFTFHFPSTLSTFSSVAVIIPSQSSSRDQANTFL